MTTQNPLNELYFRSTGAGTSDIELSAIGTNGVGELVGTLTTIPKTRYTAHRSIVDLRDGTRKEFTSGSAAREYLYSYFDAI